MGVKSAAWRRKREEVIELYGSRCSFCGAAPAKLNVHHRYYEAGKKPHDYPTETLDLLCNKCHGDADELRRRIVRATGWLAFADTEQAIGYMQALAALDGIRKDRPALISVGTWEHASGVGDALCMSAEEVIARAIDVGPSRGRIVITEEDAREVYRRKRRSK